MFKFLFLFVSLVIGIQASQCDVTQNYFNSQEPVNSQVEKNPSLEKMTTFSTESGLIVFNYKEAVEVAKKLNRKIFIIVAQAGCPAWNNFASEIDKKNSLFNKYLKDLYIVALIPSSDLNKYPQYRTDISPTIFITTASEEIIANPIKGAPTMDAVFAEYIFDLAFF